MGQRLQMLIYRPVPFTMLMINNVTVDERPHCRGGIQETAILCKLISIIEAYHRFRLRPPVFFFV
ncbi:hypothetical protein D3C85_1794650 [compost metagenome]